MTQDEREQPAQGEALTVEMIRAATEHLRREFPALPCAFLPDCREHAPHWHVPLRSPDEEAT